MILAVVHTRTDFYLNSLYYGCFSLGFVFVADVFFFAFSYLSSMIIIYNCLSRIKEKGVYTRLVIFVVVCSSLVDSHTHGGITKLAIIKRKNVCIHEMRNKKL